MKKRIGIFRGTFDPIHNGHLVLLEDMKKENNLDEILIMVVGDSPYKAPAFSRWLRVALLSLALSERGVEWATIDTREVVGRGTSVHTIEIIEELDRDNNDYFLIIGPDQAAQLKHWHRSEELFPMLSGIIIFDRIPGVSSTAVKKAIIEGNNKYVEAVLPRLVFKWMKDHGVLNG